MRARSLVFVAVIVGGAGVGYAVLHDGGPSEVFCTAEGLIHPNGRTYGRAGPDCEYVDEDGNPPPGICYAAESATVVPCYTPGARPAE